MAYIGKPPNTAIVNQATSQSFSGNGSTTAFTLTRSVNVGEDLEVVVNNVQQEPGSGKSYTASGTTLTFDEAPPSGTNNVYVIYRGEATINPRLEHDANAALAATTGTFTGDLTVDTDTLKVDSSNNRLGVGTASPSTKIHLNESGSANAVQRVQAGTNGYAAQVHLYGNNVGGSAFNAVKSFVNGDSTPQWEITGPEASAEDVMTLHTGGSERVRIDSSGRVGIGTNSPDADLHVDSGDASTNYSGGALLLSNPGMDTNYGGTFLYHHKAGGSGNQNAAFNISQRTAAGAYVSNIWNVDYQNNVQSFYLPNGAQSGVAVLNIDGAGRVTTPSQPAFEVTNNPGIAAGNTVTWGTVSANRGNNWDASTNSFVAPVAGFYCFTLTIFTDRTTATGDFFWDVYLNNSFRHRLYQAKNGSTNSHLQLNAAFAFYLSLSDSVKIYYATGPANTAAGSTHNKFAGFLVG